MYKVSTRSGALQYFRNFSCHDVTLTAHVHYVTASLPPRKYQASRTHEEFCEQTGAKIEHAPTGYENSARFGAPLLERAGEFKARFRYDARRKLILNCCIATPFKEMHRFSSSKFDILVCQSVNDVVT